MRLHRYILLSAIWALLGPVGTSRAQTCTFDAQGRLTLVKYSSTQTVAYAYDSAGNITNQLVSGILGEPDTDSDSLPDAWEWVWLNGLTNTAAGDFNQDTISNLKHYQDATDPADPDSDHDGALNVDELRAGTDPLNSNSYLGVQSFLPHAVTTGMLIRWYSASSKVYRLERATNLLSGFDYLVRTNIPAAYPINTETDKSASGRGLLFYRIELQ